MGLGPSPKDLSPAAHRVSSGEPSAGRLLSLPGERLHLWPVFPLGYTVSWPLPKPTSCSLAAKACELQRLPGTFALSSPEGLPSLSP